MEWFDSNVGSAQCPLKQRPKVIQSLRVYLHVDVFMQMIDDFMHEVTLQMIEANTGVGIDLAAVLYVVKNRVLQSFALDVGNDLGPYLSQISVEHSENSGLTDVHVTTSFSTANLSPSQCTTP